jgi:hypothetical protein
MEEIKPGIPDIIEPLTAEMERRGIASRKSPSSGNFGTSYSRIQRSCLARCVSRGITSATCTMAVA